MRSTIGIVLGFAALVTVAHPAEAAAPGLSDSFRLGSGGGVLCRVQTRSRDAALATMFDRSWAIVCRDAAKPIGTVRALRGREAEARAVAARADTATCSGSERESVDDLGSLAVGQCRLKAASVGYKVYTLRRGNVTWIAEGLAGYDSALKLALRTVVTDRIVPGKVTVATTSVDDPVAFARVQAGTLDPDQALAEGYRRNNSGDYAEAAEFFDTLQQRVADGSGKTDRSGEYRINQALQRSNLGDFAEADALFAEARAVPTTDRVQTRLRRNFEALHLLNQQRYSEALVRLDQPVVPLENAVATAGGVEIGAAIAAEINSGVPVAKRLGATESTSLTADERAEIIDAQALQIKGTLLRLTGKPAEARTALEAAGAQAVAVRQGRVLSIVRLRAQVLAETGLALEDMGDVAGGEARLRAALALLETRYPQTIAVNGARARLAAYLARHGQSAAAMTEFRAVVQSAAETRSSVTGLGNLLSPYFALLVDGMPADPALADDFFLATQTLVRPGVADTQAILARELSEGAGPGSRLFRQARTLERDIERTRIELANLVAAPQQSADIRQAIAALNADLAQYATEQIATQSELAAFPQYRALTPNALTLGELKSTLKPGEAYLKLTVAGRGVFAILARPEGAQAWRVALSPDQLDVAVTSLRETIVTNENGQLNTYPFDVAAAHDLYVALAGPTAAQLPNVKHLIFEPDGAMLRLPLDLLVTDAASVAQYKARTADANADQFDFTGTKWLGRTTMVSTAVAARAFRDVRALPQSAATAQYLGFGQNAPVAGLIQASATRSLGGAGAVDCNWPVAEWSKPVSAAELRTAAAATGGSQIVTGADFTDSAVKARADLANYRILHFATHGLVTAPRPECPARPALLTSFAPSASDGLLDFGEIYALKIDADLVILSACDTAGTATVAATRAAGITSGGGNALDGLVRAFIGAGGRSVLASHWPAPDDFNATERLISGLFKGGSTASVGEALMGAQATLMDEAATSHPYYWAGFAVVGDGAQRLLSAR
ncbi:CHAT domain-containing protein [Sphingomonas sp. SUN039]|uniref:CHAT domain-containing protein n=1 Tax=Sphingomonas sp. SUN039 TaxID=2937787 RepID=UPI0021646A51|nr:CHAT domain-containing protein [Sphingomonas sp. SUN039]UVO53388.1 CHAT domain-containing protein [Sphingomonas sp. SUN039]